MPLTTDTQKQNIHLSKFPLYFWANFEIKLLVCASNPKIANYKSVFKIPPEIFGPEYDAP